MPRQAAKDESPRRTDVDQFATLRNEHAERLFDLAREAASAGHANLALELAAKTLREDPDHAEARRVLGYDDVDGQWRTPYEQEMARRGNVWHERFGWIKASDVEKYESGMRPRGRNWITAEQDAAARRTIGDGWIVTTEHFEVTTNHSLEEGVALARRLEELHDVWRQQFADYWLPASELQDVFAGRRRLVGRARPHQVWYFKSRDGYNAALRREQPRIDITLGIYFDTHRRAYFFAGEDHTRTTIYHEAAHQLFQEARPRSARARLVGRANNVWIIEGIATYFETLAIHDDPVRGRYYTLGGTDAGRLPTARARVLQENYYVPLADLVRLGKDDLQRRSDLTQLYSQLAGLTTFFLNAEGGRYRRALVDYLIAVYSSRADENTLSKLTGQSYAELDAAYRVFLESLP